MTLQGNAEDASAIIAFNARYLEPFRAEDVAVLIIDHQSKPQAGQAYKDKRPFGSAYKGLLARSVIQVEAKRRGDNSLTVALRQTKHNFGALAEPFGARLDFAPESVKVDEANLDAAESAGEQSPNAKELVMRVLKDGLAHYPQDVAKATGLALKTVKNVLSSLRKEGAVEPTGTKKVRTEQVRLRAPRPSP